MYKEELNVILFGFLFLAIGVLARQFVVARGLTLPVHIFMTLAGFLIGIASTLLDIDIDPLHLKDVSPETPFNIYMCVLMFECAFNTEVHYLKIIAYHMAVVAIPMIVLIYVILCSIGLYFFTYEIKLNEYIAMLSVIMMPGPHMMKAYLAPTNVQHDLKTLLEGETMFGNYIVYLAFKIATKNDKYPTAIVFVFLDLLVGFTVGLLIGKLTIYWISNIYKDNVNQITIVLAFCYGGFALSFLLSSSGFLCVVVIGLVISHRRSSMSTQFVQLFNCVMELIVFCLTSLTCLSAGVYLMTMVVMTITLQDIIVTFVIFFIQNFIRAFVLFLGYYFKARHLETKTNTVTIWACNIRGSYSVMMAFCLHGSGFKAEQVSKQITLVLMQIVLSFIANSVMCSYVIGYLNEDSLSKKKWMIERAARLMIAIRKSTVTSLRNTASIADADWNVVIKQSRLKTDFMTVYRYAGWLDKQLENRESDMVDPAIDMKEEAVRQISLSEKASYSKLYAFGMLTRESVINFMYLVTQCIKFKRPLLPKDIIMGPGDISFLNKVEKELVVMINAGPRHMCYRVFMLTIFFADILEIFSAFFFIIFDQMVSAKIMIITSHNILMVSAYVVILVCGTVKKKSFKSTSLWHALYKIVVLVSIFDLLVTAYPVHSQSTLNKLVNEIGRRNFQQFFISLNVVCVFTRILRSLPVVQVIPMFQLYILKFVTHMQSKKVFIECDMATGYIRVSTETLKKIKGITTDPGLILELKNFCHKNKLETAQYLAFCQLKLPGVVAALKTKTALRTVLNTIENTLIEMEEMGLLGEMDASIVHKEISVKIMAAQSFPYVINAVSTRSLLENISWVENDEQLLNEIENRGTIIKFYSNDVIVTEGYYPGGLFIILNGLVRSESLLEVDNTMPLQSEKAMYYCSDRRKTLDDVTGHLILHGFCTRGNIIGELAFLNDRPEHKTYRCATYVEALFISSLDLAELTNGRHNSLDPLSPIELRIWRAIAIRQAVRMIHSGILSSNVQRMTIFNRMMDSYIVDGNITQTLTVSPDEVAAVILIQGYISHYYSELRYVGPCILPCNQQKFLSHPELGPRVIYLIIKSKSMEDTGLESLVPEEPQMADYEDSLTISSGASDVGPFRREKYDPGLKDESDYAPRALACGMSEELITKVINYKVNVCEKQIRTGSVTQNVEPIKDSRMSGFWHKSNDQDKKIESETTNRLFF